MENASKALIIAGAILLAILIISLGILIYNQASGIVSSNSMSEVDIQTFNNKFTQYGGEQRGSAVRALVQQIDASNAVPENEKRQVSYDDGSDVKSLADVDTGAMYTVTCTPGDDGLIETIDIQEN